MLAIASSVVHLCFGPSYGSSVNADAAYIAAIMAVLTKKVSAPELKKSEDVKKTPIHYPFWFGGSASCFATFFTHPLDLGKQISLSCTML